MITNYDELKTAIARWLKRADLTNDIPNFIQLAEAVFNRRLRTLEMEEVANFNISPGDASPGYAPLPVGYHEMRNMTVNGRDVTYKTPSMLNQMNPTSRSGLPMYYTIVNKQLKFNVIPDGTYAVKMDYYQKVPALSDSNTTNWVLDQHPDLYLYQALLESAPFLKDDARLTTWGLKLEGLPGSDKGIGIYDQIARDDRKKRWSGASMNKSVARMVNDGYRSRR